MSRVEIELVDGKIWAKIPYQDGQGPKQAKAIPGARPKYGPKPANPARKAPFLAWVYPLNMEICRIFRQTYGQDLKVGKELAVWARAEITRESSQLALRSAVDADLTEVPKLAPALDKAMSARKFQRAGARFIADGGQVIIADEPGLGKTLEALGGLVESGAKRVLVFAKVKAIETVWVPEVKRWLGDGAEVYAAQGSLKNRQKVLADFLKNAGSGEWDGYDTPGFADRPMSILVCNIEMARMTKVAFCPGTLGECDGYDFNCEFKRSHKVAYDQKFPELFAMTWDAIVVDESHKALIGKNTMSKGITQTRLGMMKLPLRKGGQKVALSGTPFRGKLWNIWGTLNWLRPDVFTSYWTFAKTYFKVDENRHGGMEILGMDPAKEAAFDRMLAPYMLRRTKEEVAADLPPRQYGGTPLDPTDPSSAIGVWLDLEPAQARQYKRIESHGEILAADGEALHINGILAELTRRKQFAICDWDIDTDGQTFRPGKRTASNKYQWLLEFVSERAEAGQKVVVASQFTKVVNAFSEWLAADGIESYTLTGETSAKRVAANVAAFNDPEDVVPVFLLNIMAGGESINLDRCCDELVFLDETFIPDDQEQVENRIHRMSNTDHQVTIWYVRSRGTVEEDICRITEGRGALTKGRLDGARGIETYRRLLKAA